MNLLKMLILSLKLPQKQAFFQLNRMNMGTTIGYAFSWLFIAIIPSGIRFFLQQSELPTNGSPTMLALQFFIIYYALFSFLGLIVISITAVIGHGITKLLHRKLRYQQLWKMTVFALTIPMMIFIVIEIFLPNYKIITLPFIVFTLTLLALMARHLPKRKKSVLPDYHPKLTIPDESCL